MNLGDLTSLVEKPIAAVSNLLNTPNSAGRYRPFYLQNVIDAVQGRSLEDAVANKVVVVTGGSSGIGEAVANRIAAAGGELVLVATNPRKPRQGRRRHPRSRRHRTRLSVRSVGHGRDRGDGR